MSQPSRTKRLASEGAVIVLSILLAFWIDAWWDLREARVAEATVLESIREEVGANRLELDRFEARDAAQSVRMDRFLAMTPDQLRSLDPDSVVPWLSAMMVTWTYDADDSASRLFLGSTTPVTEHGREVRSALARWVRIMEDTDEEKAAFWDTGAEVAGLVASHAGAAASDGQGVLYTVAARLGPELLAQLREDDRYVTAVLYKGHYQKVYRMELGDASALLDSLRTLVSGSGGAVP